MQNFVIEICQEKPGISGSGVAKYVDNHLMKTKEVGCFAQLPRSLDSQGFPSPHLHNRPLWLHVGHDSGACHVGKRLIRNLCLGLNLSGDQLPQTVLLRPPVEWILTFPAELTLALVRDPQAMYTTLSRSTQAFCNLIDHTAVAVDVGGGKVEFFFAQTLTLAYFHAENEAGEPFPHAHVLTFPPALDQFGRWRTYTSRALTDALHEEGGGREVYTRSVILEVAKFHYVVERQLEELSPNQPHGVRVICPGGVVIEPGSVPRLRSAEVRAEYAMFQALGVAMLTQKELALVLTQSGEIPVAGAGGHRQVLFEAKLATLRLLDVTGRVRKDLISALAEIDVELATVQASLLDLPFQESQMASSVVRARREDLREQVPQIDTDDWAARLIWTARYDASLAAAVEARQDWAQLPPWARGTMFLLERYRILSIRWDGDCPKFSLTEQGESRRMSGRQEEREIEASVPHLFAQVLVGDPSPAVILGRLRSAGVRVRGTLLEFRRISRVTEAGEELYKAGIADSTKAVLDAEWWQGYWRRRSELPPVLGRVVLMPEEVPPEWHKGANGGRRNEFVPPAETEDLQYKDMGWDREEAQKPEKQILHQLQHAITPKPQEPSNGVKNDRKR